MSVGDYDAMDDRSISGTSVCFSFPEEELVFLAKFLVEKHLLFTTLKPTNSIVTQEMCSIRPTNSCTRFAKVNYVIQNLLSTTKESE